MGLKKLTRRNLPFQTLADESNNGVANRGANTAPAERGYPTARPEDAVRIGQWIGELPGLMRELNNASEFSPEPAHWFLTTYGRLSRLHPCLLPMPEGNSDVLSDAQALIEERGGDLVRAAAGRREASGGAAKWLEQAAALVRSYEETESSAASRLHTARLLLNQLDDLDLLRYAGGRADPGDQAVAGEMRKQAAACYQFVTEHAAGFLAAAEDCRRILSLMRADLPSVDRDLARTALKYMRVVEAADQMTAELTFADHAPLEVDLAARAAATAPDSRGGRAAG